MVTFSDSVTFHLNGREAFVFHVERAHTDGDAVIHFREDNVIHAGDAMFNGLFPFIDLDSGGTVDGYIAAQERILGWPTRRPRSSRATVRWPARRICRRPSTCSKTPTPASAPWSRPATPRTRSSTANPLADYHDDWSWQFITTERMTRTLYRAITSD